MRKIIAIDGPSGVGKSSVSRQLAARLGWTYLDTGAMYRAVTLAWLEAGAKPTLLENHSWLTKQALDMNTAGVMLNDRDVSQLIRSERVTARVSEVASAAEVRQVLTTMQREIGNRRPCVLDGRDIGTVVFPDAFFKVFLQASDEVRAHRRWLQLGGPDCDTAYQTVLSDLLRRDRSDSSRVLAPLRQAEDAMVLDTDDYDEPTVILLLEQEALKRLARWRS